MRQVTIAAILLLCLAVAALAYIDDRSQAGTKWRGWDHMVQIVVCCVLGMIALIVEVYHGTSNMVP